MFDGIRSVDITVWADAYNSTDKLMIKDGAGIKMIVEYDKNRDNFRIKGESQITPLRKKGESEIEVRPERSEKLEAPLI